ncbi:MAG: carboxypeptidase-like regulatory domain-containing protein [Bacteroidetes bacterium]|nr:carboxypeptidase-like regulatory domain-containing protein [Bacteroidota bacterium]
MIRTILCALVFLALPLFGQQWIVTGVVTDKETGAPLPSATVRVTGTPVGTITNTEGEFRLPVSGSVQQLTASYIGYGSDSVTVSRGEGGVRFRLVPSSIQLAAVTVTDEDPAVEIIRRAIESKKRWMSRLQMFEGKAFNRTLLRADDSIAAITEGYSTLYWKQDDSLREVVTQRKQTGNLPAAMVAPRTGEIVNFNDDRIRLGGFQFTGPTAPDALEAYDVRLRSTRKMDGFDVYTIELLPRSAVRPLFRGTISIAERSYAVIDVDVRLNEAVRQLFLDARNVRYTQSFRLYDDLVWLPVSFRFAGTYDIALAGFSFPAFGIERDVVVYEYRINQPFPDSIAALPSFTFDSSASTVDSAFWSANEVLPPDAEQRAAYRTLDSTQTLEKRFAPGGTGAVLTGLSDGPLSAMELWFNRVEGVHLGINKTFKRIVEDLDLRGAVGYGFSDDAWKWKAGVTYYFGPAWDASFASANTPVQRSFALALDLYDTQIYFPEPLLPGLLLNSFSAVLLKDDVQDYYRAAGGSASFSFIPSTVTRITAGVMSEQQLSVYQNTAFSLLKKGTPYALQPGIAEGRMNAVSLSIKHGSPGILEFSKSGYRLSAAVEHAMPVLGGRFDMTRFQAKVRGKIASMLADELPFPPYLGVQLAGGFSAGHLPPQRYFELYARFETFAGHGTLKGLPRREFYGDRYVALTVDHNFRKVLFEPLGITALTESDLDLIVEVNAARSWMSAAAIRTPFFPSGDSQGWYYEGSIGLSNILDLFRFDVTRRFSSGAGWAFTLTASEFLTGMIAQ